MTNKTRELDLALSNVRFEVGGAGLQFLSPIVRREIMEICRESGLKFITERTEDDLPVYKDDYPPVRKADDPVEKLYPLPPISIPPKIEEIDV